MKSNLIEVFPDSCRGCRLCEMACSFHHDQECSSAASRIKILKDQEWAYDYPVLCIQCAEAHCVNACPTGALFRNDTTGVVEFEAKECTGCELCVAVCPIGALVLNKNSNIISKCDQCGGDPECVKWCPHGAVVFKEVDLDSPVRKGYMTRAARIIRDLDR